MKIKKYALVIAIVLSTSISAFADFILSPKNVPDPYLRKYILYRCGLLETVRFDDNPEAEYVISDTELERVSNISIQMSNSFLTEISEGIKSLEGIQYLPKLRYLSFGETYVSHVFDIPSCANLEAIESINKDTNCYVRSIGECPKLKEVDMFGSSFDLSRCPSVSSIVDRCGSHYVLADMSRVKSLVLRGERGRSPSFEGPGVLDPELYYFENLETPYLNLDCLGKCIYPEGIVAGYYNYGTSTFWDDLERDWVNGYYYIDMSRYIAEGMDPDRIVYSVGCHMDGDRLVATGYPAYYLYRISESETMYVTVPSISYSKVPVIVSQMPDPRILNIEKVGKMVEITWYQEGVKDNGGYQLSYTSLVDEEMNCKYLFDGFFKPFSDESILDDSGVDLSKGQIYKCAVRAKDKPDYALRIYSEGLGTDQSLFHSISRNLDFYLNPSKDPSLIGECEAADSHKCEYFTFEGIRLGSERPENPGIYIVRNGSQTSKIVVR